MKLAPAQAPTKPAPIAPKAAPPPANAEPAKKTPKPSPQRGLREGVAAAATPKPPPWVTTPPLTPEARREKNKFKKKRYEARNLKPRIPAVLEALSARWPLAFPRDLTQIRPWAIGLHEEVCKQVPEIPPQLIRLAMKSLTKTEAYQVAVAKGGSRYDLDGNERGVVTDEAKAAAVTMLEEIRKKMEGGTL